MEIRGKMTITNGVLTKYSGDDLHIVIPDSVKKIGERAFFGCYNLKSVVVPDSVTVIDRYAFGECSRLNSIDLPASLTTIGHKAFYQCANLNSIRIPDSVTHIGYKAFYRCTYLAEIHIPDSVASIGGGVLCGCGLGSRNIRITSDNHHLQIIYSDSSRDAGILVFDDKLFSAFGNIRSIVIPSFVKHIGDGAFSRCANLHSITIPDSVISIGKNAFYRCDFLNHIILPDSITSISEKAFYKCKGPVICVYDKIKRSQTFQYQIRYDGTAHIVGCTDRVSTNIHIPHRLDGHRVISLGDELFKGFWQLKDVTIPQGIEYIGNNFCMECFALQKLTIPGTVRYIGSNICHSCRSLEYVDLQNGIKEIGSHAFNDCRSLCNVRFPNSVEWIYGMPFDNSPVTLILSDSSDLWNSTGMNLHEKYDIPYTLGI